jgi:hypothetical protein
MDAIREDFKKTGKCRLQLARDGFSNALVAYHSLYRKTANSLKPSAKGA